MEKVIRIPRNISAAMQALQRLMASGHIYWCAGTVPKNRLVAFIEKWESRGLVLRADAPKRSYRKKKELANHSLVIAPDWREATDSDPVSWIITGTVGIGSMATMPCPPAPVFDARRAAGRIDFVGYELALLPKAWIDADGLKQKDTTWTWRLNVARLREWEAYIIELAKQRDRTSLAAAFAGLAAMPQFAGVRSQIFRLHKEANKMLAKVGGEPLSPLNLPKMRMIKLYNNEESGV